MRKEPKLKKTEAGIIVPVAEEIRQATIPDPSRTPTKQDNVDMICQILNAMIDAAVSEALLTFNGKTEEAVAQQNLRDKGANLIAQILLAYLDGEKESTKKDE